MSFPIRSRLQRRTRHTCEPPISPSCAHSAPLTASTTTTAIDHESLVTLRGTTAQRAAQSPSPTFLTSFWAPSSRCFSCTRAPRAACTLVEPYPAPIFNHSWAQGAVYKGVRWFHKRLCRTFTGVYPFFIQGEIRVSDYYEDFFTGWRSSGTKPPRSRPPRQATSSLRTLTRSTARSTRMRRRHQGQGWALETSRWDRRVVRSA